MPHYAVIETATGKIIEYQRWAAPAHDHTTQIVRELPRRPDMDLERWDDETGLRGLNAEEQAKYDAAQAALAASAQVDALASQRQLMFKVLEALELLDRRIAFIESRLSITFTSETAAEVAALRTLGATIKEIVGDE